MSASRAPTAAHPMPMPAAVAVDTPLEAALGGGVLVLVDNAVEGELVLAVDAGVVVAVIELVGGTVGEVVDLVEEDPWGPPPPSTLVIFGAWNMVYRMGERQKDREPCGWRRARAKISIPTTQRMVDDADSGIETRVTIRHLETLLVDHRRCSICSLETRLCRSRKMWKERISEKVCCHLPLALRKRAH
jgi:hypothetical protein